MNKRKVRLDWQDVTCTTHYEVQIRAFSKHGKTVVQTVVDESQLTTKRLGKNKTHFWQVRACNPLGCGKQSKWQSFTVSGN